MRKNARQNVFEVLYWLCINRLIFSGFIRRFEFIRGFESAMIIQYYGHSCFKITTKPAGRATEDVTVFLKHECP